MFFSNPIIFLQLFLHFVTICKGFRLTDPVRIRGLIHCITIQLQVLYFADSSFNARRRIFHVPSKGRNVLTVTVEIVDAGLFLSNRNYSSGRLFDESILFKNIVVIFTDVRGNPFHPQGRFGHLAGCR